MLRRNSSRNKQRRPLSRSKSTNSIVRSSVHLLEVIDPVAAERDAHIAAVLSYHRAQSRRSHEMAAIPRDPASFYLDRSDGARSSTGQGLERNHSTRSRGDGSVSASGVRRQQSVRFAGPSARPRRTLVSRATDNPGASDVDNSSLHVLGNMDNRPASTMSYSRRKPDPHALTRRYLDSLQAPDQCYAPEDDIDSLPSSFRRLRKSKSMFSTFNPLNPGYHFNNGTPEKVNPQPANSGSTPTQKENDPIPRDHPPRPSTSLSVLKSRRFVGASRSTSRAENDLAVQLAREKFREQVEGQSRLRSQPSMLFRSRNKRSESSLGFRKSLRNSSNNSTALSSTFSTHSLSISKQPGLRKTARKVSKTLKTKLKGLFSRPKSAAGNGTEGNDPDLCESDGESCLRLEDDLTHHEASMFRVPSHVPSLHAVPSHQEMRSRKGSVESIDSGEHEIPDDKSRVTSWSNSVTNTASSVGDWERQRLSIIKENCAHISTLSRAADEPGEAGKGQETSLGQGIDSQRVYSALMKRMQDIKRQEEALKDRINSGEGWRTSTIRSVQVDDDVFGSQGDDLTTINTSNCENASSSKGLIATPAVTASESQATADKDEPASPHRRAAGVQLEPPTTLTQRSSAFFASPTCHLFRTASPYRRALRESMLGSEEQEHPELAGSKYLKSLSAISLPTRRTSSAGSDGDPRMAYAESVYSCLTDDVKPALKNLPVGPASQSHGDVTIFVDVPTYKPTLLQHQRDVSTASSVEWKTWLSANVSKLEAPITPSKAQAEGEVSDMLLKLGHIRERAEIDSPQEALRSTRQESNEPSARSPLSPVEGNTRSNSDVIIPHSSSARGALSSDENEAPGAAEFPDWQGKCPPIPPRKHTRPVPSLLMAKDNSETNTPDKFAETPRELSFNTVGRLTSSHGESMQKRRTRLRTTGWHGSPAQSSPGMTGAIERKSPAQRSGWSTSHSTPRTRRRIDGYSDDQEDSEQGRLGLDAEVMGSKMMVDMFLNSRRNRIPGSVTGAGMGSSPAAFI